MKWCGCKCLGLNCSYGIPVLNYQRKVKIMLLAIGVCYMTFMFYHNVYGYSMENNSSATNNILLLKQKLEDTAPNAVNVIVNSNLNSNSVLNEPISLRLPSSSSLPSLKLYTTIVKHQSPQENGRQNDHQMNERAVTATPKPSTTKLNDIFITVKTTKMYHDTRLALIIKTWFQLAKEQTWFFTDAADKLYQRQTNDHLINTNCSMGHFRKALCCKMAVEFDTFLESGKKWFCHFDDDNYVNIPRLVSLLNDYSPSVDWYLGKPSIASPLEIFVDGKHAKSPLKKISFVFATGGAGFCLSRALALKMLPVAGNGKFVTIGDNIGLPDDVTMGYIIEYLLKVSLTVVDGFHSHLEPMEFLPQDTFKEQVSFSYGQIKNERNIVQIDGFDHKIDPTRFNTLHCYLFPYVSFCSKKRV